MHEVRKFLISSTYREATDLSKEEIRALFKSGITISEMKKMTKEQYEEFLKKNQ